MMPAETKHRVEVCLHAFRSGLLREPARHVLLIGGFSTLILGKAARALIARPEAPPDLHGAIPST